MRVKSRLQTVEENCCDHSEVLAYIGKHFRICGEPLMGLCLEKQLYNFRIGNAAGYSLVVISVK